MKKLVLIIALIFLTNVTFAQTQQGQTMTLEDKYSDPRMLEIASFTHVEEVRKDSFSHTDDWVPSNKYTINFEPQTYTIGNGFNSSFDDKLLELKATATQTKVIYVGDKFMHDPEIQKSICKVYGHRWRYEDQILMVPAVYYTEYTANALVPDEIRCCEICGKREIKKTVSEWKDLN